MGEARNLAINHAQPANNTVTYSGQVWANRKLLIGLVLGTRHTRAWNQKSYSISSKNIPIFLTYSWFRNANIILWRKSFNSSLATVYSGAECGRHFQIFKSLFMCYISVHWSKDFTYRINQQMYIYKYAQSHIVTLSTTAVTIIVVSFN